MENMKFNHAEKGQSLVELALTSLIILTLLAGAGDFGMAFFSYVAIRDAAQEGALYGSIYPYFDSNGNSKYDSGEPLNIGAIKNRVQSASGPPSPPSPTKPKPVDLYDLTKVTISVTMSDLPCACVTVPCRCVTVPCIQKTVPNSITVSVTYKYTLTMPLIGAIIGPTITLPASATDTILTPLCP